MPKFAATVAAILLFAAACTGAKGPPSSNEVRIALEAPITGDQKSNGIDMLNGARLAVDEVNAEGGLFGRKINLIEVDDKADAKVGVAAARKAVKKKIFGVIGPYNSSVGVETLPIYIKTGVVPVHLTSNSSTNGMGYTLQPKDVQIAPVEAKAIATLLSMKRVAMIYDTSTYTIGIATQLRDSLTQMGVQVVAYEPVSEGMTDFKDVIDKVKAANPDLLYVGTYYPEAGLIVKQAAGIAAKCFVGLATQDPGFVKAAGMENATTCLSSGVPSARQFPAAARYVKAYEDEFDTAPGTWGTFTYDSVKFLVDGVRRAGAWDADKVRTILSATTDFAGITGRSIIEPATGNRANSPVVVLNIDAQGHYHVDEAWAKFAGFTSS